MPPYISASAEAGPFGPTIDSSGSSLIDQILRLKPLPTGHLNWPLASQVLSAPHTFCNALAAHCPLSDDPDVTLSAMDALADLYSCAADIWIQQDLLEDAIHQYAAQRDASARRLMRRFRDLEEFPEVKSVARSLISSGDVHYTRDFVVRPTFADIDARDFARTVTNYSPCIICHGTEAEYHRSIDCPHYRCPRCHRRQPGHVEARCAVEELEAHTFPPDVRSLTDLVKGGVFTQQVARMWLLSADYLYVGNYTTIASRPTDLLPPLFRAKRIELENAHRWYVVRNGRIDGAYANQAKVSALSMHVEGALISIYDTRHEAHLAIAGGGENDPPFIDETELVGARPPPHERHENTGQRPPTPHPGRSHGSVPLDPSSPAYSELSDASGNDENDENEPPPVVPPPIPPPSYEPVEGMMSRVPLRQLTLTPTSSFQPSPSPSPVLSVVRDIVHATTGEVVGRLHRHTDGTTTVEPTD